MKGDVVTGGASKTAGADSSKEGKLSEALVAGSGAGTSTAFRWGSITDGAKSRAVLTVGVLVGCCVGELITQAATNAATAPPKAAQLQRGCAFNQPKSGLLESCQARLAAWRRTGEVYLSLISCSMRWRLQ